MPKIQITRSNRQLPQINTKPTPLPLDQIIQANSSNPIAAGIDSLGQALERRAALRKQGETLAKIEGAYGLGAGSLSGLDTKTATEVGSGIFTAKAKRTQKYLPVGNGLVLDTESGTYMTPPAGSIPVKGQGQPKSPKLKLLGINPETGEPVNYNPETGEQISNGKPYRGAVIGASQGTEQTRRDALVTGAINSLDQVSQLLTPDVLSEIKAIRASPGKSYAQVASPEAKQLYSHLVNAMANEGYLKSGATLNSDELERSANNYLAALGDNPADFTNRMGLLRSNIRLFGSPSPKSKVVTKDLALQFIQKANGDKTKAREMAKSEGYSF